MILIKKNAAPRLLMILVVVLLLSGCISLADDITPPPDNVQAEALPTSSQPTLQPTDQPLSTDESESEDNPEDGFVNVFIQDNTEGEFLDSAPVVLLEGYDQFERQFVDELPVSSDGFVQFTSVPFPAGRVYFASIDFGGAVYRSQIFQVEEGQSSLDLEVVIFNTTTDQSGLIIDRVHVLLDFTQPGFIDFVEIYIFSNLGNSTIVPETPGGVSVEFPLPAGAIGIGFEDGNLGQRYLKTEDGFGDTVSIPPGSGIYPVSVFYSLPYEENELDFEQRFDYPVGAVILMLPAGDFIVQGPELEDQGVQAIPSGEVQIYSSQSIAPDDNLEFKISGKPDLEITQVEVPSPASSKINFDPLIIYGAGGVGLALLISGVWLFIRNQKQDQEQLDPEVITDTQEEILDSIIALDDLFENGEINKEAYNQKRKQLKDQLKSLSGD